MGIDLNTKAYEILIQIEVGIREFLIDLIKTQGIINWHINFLGDVQKESLQEIAKRISEAQRQEVIPEINDQYIFKLTRAIKDNKNSFNPKKLKHPFYYLNWTDLESLLRFKPNVNIIENVIGKSNRELLSFNLNNLNLLRNDIAHSRFISKEDFNIISGAYKQVSGLIPNFEDLKNKQTEEDYYQNLIKEFEDYIDLILLKDKLDIAELEAFDIRMHNCLNSFWINSFKMDLIKQINLLKGKIEEYRHFRTIPGGLLKIVRWRRINCNLLNEIKILIHE